MLSSAEQKERNIRIAAILGTLFFHALLVAILCFFTLHPKIQLQDNEGVEIKKAYYPDLRDSINSAIQFSTSIKDSALKLPRKN